MGFLLTTETLFYIKIHLISYLFYLFLSNKGKIMKNKSSRCSIVLLLVSVITVLTVFSFVPAIPQELSYHNFANDNSFASIPHFLNVITNAGFIISGIWGVVILKRHRINSVMVWSLCIGMVLTGIGSAYYHYNPHNETLVWDRLPMTIVFSSFFAEVYAYYFNQKHAFYIWVLTLITGLASIAYWYYTESIGDGDLRLYAIVQFLPMVLITIIVFTFSDQNKTLHLPFLVMFLCYATAKIFEYHDNTVYEQTHSIGGHCIKHLFASLATACIVWNIKRRCNDLDKNAFNPSCM